MESKVVDGIEYRLVTVRKRTKWISKEGFALNPKRNQKASIHLNQDGYPCFGGGAPCHLYVGYAWVEGYFEGAEINHKDFDRMNYRWDNLEWISHRDNVQYSVKHNSEIWKNARTGEKNGRAKYTEEQVLEIRRLYKELNSVMEIIKIYHPSYSYKQRKDIWSTISHICKNDTWKNI